MSSTLGDHIPIGNPADTGKPDAAAPWPVLAIRLAASVAVLTGLVVLAGWIWQVPLLKSVLPGAVEMKANTALGLIAAGAALWLLAHPRSVFFQRTGQALALFVAALGLATLTQYLFGWRLGIDELLFLDTQGHYNAARGRMSPYTATAFVSMGWALLLLPNVHRRALAALAFLGGMVGLVIGLLSAIGYAWNAAELTTDVLLPPVAVNTAVVLVFLGAGILLAVRQRLAQTNALSLSLNSMEGKIFTGFAASFLLLAIGAGATYQATTIFTRSAQQVAHTYEVRTALMKLYSELSDAGLAQRTYLITGQPRQLSEYQSRLKNLEAQTAQISLLLSDNARQMENLAPIAPLIDRTRQLLDQGVALYQTQGFAAAKQLVDSGQSLTVMDSLFWVVQLMKDEEDVLLAQHEAEAARFQRYMLVSMLLTMVFACCIFSSLYFEIRREMQARHQANLALVNAKNMAELAKQEADTANRAKGTFLATMSHEIRTPMNGVMGMLELLSLSQLDNKQHTTLKVIRESGRSLIRIIDDILDFSKMEALKLEIQPEVVSIKNLIEDFHNLYAGNASSKGLTISCSVDGALSPALMVDPIRLRQILDNLVSNAIKFTSAGQIRITAEVAERGESAQRVRFSVKDTGIGVSEEHQLRLFQPFVQAESSTARRYGGSGLGLAICQRLVHLMGGTIQMDSAPDKGTTVTLELLLPLADPKRLPAREATSTAPSLVATAGLRRAHPTVAEAAAEGTLVLLADDHPTNLTLLLRQVNLLGYAAECARTGVEALALWESGRFSLLLTDCNMPEMDGYELTRVIRAKEGATGAQRLPIVACTANALAGEIEVCLSVGMDDYLAKPIELKTLLRKLDRWLPLPVSVFAPPEPAHPAPAARAQSPIDHAALARVSAGDVVIEREIFAQFQLANDQDAIHLEQAVADGDTVQVARLIHRIKGACAMVGALRLASVCEHIEQANRDGDRKAIMASMQAFHQEVANLNQYFAGLRQLAQAL